MEDRMIQKETGESVQSKPSRVVNTTVNQGSPQTEADHKKQVFSRVIRAHSLVHIIIGDCWLAHCERKHGAIIQLVVVLHQPRESSA